MGMIEQTRFVERLQFFNGQRLFADDLQGIEAFNREMRWLHNRSLHQPGIGNGYVVRSEQERSVWIGAGYALDALGREIVLTQPQTLQVPPVAGDEGGQPAIFDLAVRYPDDADLEEAETRLGVCNTRGVVRLQEAPIFCWVRLQRTEQGELVAQDAQMRQAILDGMLIVLARIEVLHCKLYGFLSIAERRNARPECLPYIACGVAEPVLWERNSDDLAGRYFTPIILSADIDTKAAGFLTVPCYEVAILGPRVAHFAAIGTSFLFIDQTYIETPRHDGFIAFVVVEYHLIGGEYAPDEDEILRWFQENWRLQWMGVEG